MQFYEESKLKKKKKGFMVVECLQHKRKTNRCITSAMSCHLTSLHDIVPSLPSFSETKALDLTSHQC